MMVIKEEMGAVLLVLVEETEQVISSGDQLVAEEEPAVT